MLDCIQKGELAGIEYSGIINLAFLVLALDPFRAPVIIYYAQYNLNSAN